MPPERRAVALGAWGGIAGLAIAIGPLVGGAIAEGLDWHWIFWLNVPIGLIVLPLAALRLTETYGPESRLDLPGLGLVSAGLLALVWGVIHGNDLGWDEPRDRRGARRRRRPARRLRRLGGAPGPPDAAAALLPQPGVQRRERSSRC